MKYDDASWHYGGDFPEDLPEEAGSTHIGMFFAWAWLSGFAQDQFHHPNDQKLAEDLLEALQLRRDSPGKLFRQFCDEKLSDADLNAAGNAFATEFYSFYGSDYSRLANDLPSFYHVPDAWDTYDRIAPILTQRLEDWRSEQR